MVYVFLAEGFEEIEAVAPTDILRRGGVEVITVGVGGRTVTGTHGIPFVCDITSDELALADDLEMIFLPGGMPGAENLAASEEVKAAAWYAAKTGRYLAAICAAPSAYGKWGLLKGKQYTCYPGFQNDAFGGEYTGAPIALDEKLVTGIGPGAALGFGRVLLQLLRGEETADRVAGAMFSE